MDASFRKIFEDSLRQYSESMEKSLKGDQPLSEYDLETSHDNAKEEVLTVVPSIVVILQKKKTHIQFFLLLNVFIN